MKKKSDPSSLPALDETKNLLSDADKQALEEFAEGVALEDMDFHSWKKAHQSLDLTIPLFLSKQQAGAAGEKELRYSQTVHADKPSLGKSRVPTSVMISWLAGVADGEVFYFKDKGDIKGTKKGQLIVTIRIKEN